jgi:hypothetical protein
MIETLFTFFTLGTFGFWLLMAIASVIFISSIENDHYTFPSIILALIGIAYWKPLMSLALDWRGIVACIIGYVVIGMAWSVYRWFRYVKVKIDKYKDEYPDAPVDGGRYTHYDTLENSVEVSNNKARITSWIIYWPWSLIWNITGDFFTMVYESMTSIYTNISKKYLDNLKSEILSKKNNAPIAQKDRASLS